MLAECSPYVPEEVREQIERAIEGSRRYLSVRQRRVLDRIEVEPSGDTEPFIGEVLAAIDRWVEVENAERFRYGSSVRAEGQRLALHLGLIRRENVNTYSSEGLRRQPRRPCTGGFNEEL